MAWGEVIMKHYYFPLGHTSGTMATEPLLEPEDRMNSLSGIRRLTPDDELPLNVSTKSHRRTGSVIVNDQPTIQMVDVPPVQREIRTTPGYGSGVEYLMNPLDARRLVAAGSLPQEGEEMFNRFYFNRFPVGSQRPSNKIGDAQAISLNYHQASTCSVLRNDALARVQRAYPLLDPTHAEKIKEMVNKARLSKTGKPKEISLNKAVSISLQCDQWIYQAQAKAAKTANREVDKCRRALSHRHRQSKAEKDAAYLARYGKVRLPKGVRQQNNRQLAQAKTRAINQIRRSDIQSASYAANNEAD